MNKPEKFAIWGNTGKQAFWDLLPELMSWSEEAGLKLYITTRIASQWAIRQKVPSDIIQSADDFSKMDFILALGGDGTILGAARSLGKRNIPILGIHLGDLGFLANVTKGDLYTRLNQVAAGEYSIDARRVLIGRVYSPSHTRKYPALNDIVINPIKSHRMITCVVHTDGRLLGSYKADGIIISSPTGSTAYSLAAGGPIVVPDVESIIVTPICPHTLTSRPVVVSINTKLEITFPGETYDVGLSVDGQIHEVLTSSSQVIVQNGDYSVPFIQFSDMDYFHMLRTKMDWGKRGNNE